MKCYERSSHLLLVRQVQRLQLGVLVRRVDLQQVVEVGGEDEGSALHQLQHGAQQVLSRVLHLALQVVKDLVEAVFEKCGAHVSRPLEPKQLLTVLLKLLLKGFC